MRAIFCFLAAWSSISVSARATQEATFIFALLDDEKVAASGMVLERKVDGPDFTVRYFVVRESGSTLGVYEGGHPTFFSEGRKVLGQVSGEIAGQCVKWKCWESSELPNRYGAETLVASRRTQFEKRSYDDQFHLFVHARDLRALALARTIAEKLFKKGPAEYSPAVTEETSRQP